ncbi:sigma-70 family RNA polymerase sigma factor, partial [Chitinophaga sp.]|uniref:sigma-70 family RNA polymerase sigma factor n=1 Tax=Chitinophaga sp. TaxID=1869181 RepID=UPI002F927D8F
QTTFMKLWQYRQSLSENYNLDQHLFSIARTVFVDYLRSKSKQSKVAATADATEPEVLPAMVEERSLEQALSQMPAMRKEVFVKHRLQGYSYKEVAEQLSISIKSVDNHLAKAIKQLKKIFFFLVLLVWILC